jgi:hypothetical protein
MEVDFWGVKSSGYENSHATEVKCSNIPQNSYISYRKRSEMNVKATENLKLSGYHSSFPSRNDFLIKVLSQYRCRWGFFRAKFPMKMKAAKFYFDVYFAFFSV